MENPADNFSMTQWTRMSDTTIFNQVPFGVYAFTAPTKKVPANNVLPFTLEDTIYFGKSGNSYDDFFWDRKSFDPETKKESYHRYSIVERRLKKHRYNLLNSNSAIDRESSYSKFYEAFGHGLDLVNEMNVCVIVPKKTIPNYMVPSWLLFTESYFVHLYQQKFGRNTLMNLDHDLDHNLETKKVQDSYSSKKRQQMLSSSLSEFF